MECLPPRPVPAPSPGLRAAVGSGRGAPGPGQRRPLQGHCHWLSPVPVGRSGGGPETGLACQTSLTWPSRLGARGPSAGLQPLQTGFPASVSLGAAGPHSGLKSSLRGTGSRLRAQPLRGPRPVTVSTDREQWPWGGLLPFTVRVACGLRPAPAPPRPCSQAAFLGAPSHRDGAELPGRVPRVERTSLGRLAVWVPTRKGGAGAWAP